MKKIKNPLILLAFATTAICGLGLAAKTPASEEVKAYFTPSETFTNHDGDTYYNSISSTLDGQNLLSALRSLNSSRRKKTMGYKTGGISASDSDFIYTDYDTSDPSKLFKDKNGQTYGTVISSFYSYTPCTDFNKEHVWPNTHGGNKVEADVHMARPTIQAENSNRGHSYYVENMAHSTNGWDPYYAFHVNPGKTGDLGEQCINSRGESARIIFYCMVASDQLVLEAGHSDSSKTSNNKMGDLVDILKWHLQIPVTERENNRNEGAEYLQGNRNPFIDHRSYACKIWGNTNSTTKSLCDQYNGWTDGDEPTPSKTLVSIAVSGTPTTKSYTAGEHFSTAGLTVTAYYSDSTNENVTSKVTVSPDPLTAGTTSVTLSYKYGNDTKTAVVNGITVSSGEVTNYGTLENPISVSQAKLIIENECTGSSACYTKQQIYCRGIAGSFLSSEDTNYRHKMYVRDVNSSSSVVTLNSLNMSEEQYERLEEGDTIVFHGYGYKEGTTTDYFKYNGNYEVTLDKNESKSGDVPITSLIINNKTKDYFIGQTCTLDITVFPAYATDTITFKSNNTSVASVDTNGKVTFKAAGSATITATAKSGVSASITFNVTKVPVHVESVSASLPSNSYYVGDTASIQYSVSPDDADNQDVTFASSNTSVATVDTNGKVTFKAAGSVVFTIASKEDNTIKDTISVTVSNKPVEDIPVESVSLEIAQPKDKYEIGDTVQLSATITPANATNKTLTYSSSNPSVASVDNNGLVTCKAAGSTTITVTSNNNKTAQITIRVDTGVVPVTGVTISLPKTTYEVGETATVSYEVIPANATNKNVIFDSSNNKIATIDQNGKIEFKSVGTVDFIVRAEDNYSLSGKVTVTVTEPVSTPVEIVVKSVPNKTVYKPNEVFDKTGLVVVENYINGEMKDVTSDVTITLPDMSSAGVKEVKISYNSFSTSFEIVVTEAEISNLSIEKSPLKMNYYKNEQFDPRGLKVTVMVGDDKVDVSGIVTFEYDFESTDRVTIWFKNLKQKIIVTIETGEITDEHKAADFAYVVEDKLTDIKVEDFTLNDWNTLEHYYNTLDDAAKKVLQEQVTEYSGGAVDAAEELSATLKKCVENYDKIYLEHKDEGFNDFMSRSPVAPKKNDDKDKSNNTLLILIGIGAGVIILIVLIIVIAVSASKKSKKKHA